MKVFERRCIAHFVEGVARRPVAKLGFLAQRKQRLLTAQLGAAPRSIEHLIDRQIRGRDTLRGLRESAVVTNVATQMRQWNKYFPGIANQVSMTFVPQFCGNTEQAVDVYIVGKQGGHLLRIQVVAYVHWLTVLVVCDMADRRLPI